MADRQVVIQIQYDLPDQRQALDKLTKTTKEINNLRESNKDLRKRIKETGDANGELTRQLASQEAQVKDLSKEKRIYQNQLNATSNSAGAYRARLAELNRQMEQVDQSTEEGRAELARLKTEYDSIRHQVNAYDEAQGRHQHNVGNYQSALKGLRTSMLAIGGAITAGIAAFNRLSNAMKESIAAFQEQEQAEAQLAFVAGDATDALLAQASALQRTTTFGDEATIASQQLLLSFGATAEQVQNLIPLIQDYAAAQGVDLATATNKINNVLNGESTELRGLNLELSTTSDQTERYSEIKKALNQFSGQAANLAQTESGQLQQLENRYGDLQEQLGREYLPIQIKLLEIKMQLFQLMMEMVDTIRDIGRAFFGFQKAAEETSLVNFDLAESTQETTNQINSERAAIQQAFSTLKDDTATKESKTAAIQTLNSNYGEYLTNIDLEKASVAELVGLEEALINTLTKQIILRRKEDELNNLINQRVDLLLALEGAQNAATAAQEAANEQAFATAEYDVSPAMSQTYRAANAATQSLQDIQNALIEVDEQISNVTSRYDGMAAGITNVLIATQKTTPEVNGFGNAVGQVEGALEDLESQLDDLQPKIDALDFSELEAELYGEVDLTPKLVDFDPSSGISEELEELSETLTEDVDPAYQAYLDAQQKAIERAEQLEQRTIAAGRALQFFGQSNEQILGGLQALGEEATKTDKAFAGLAIGYNIANQALDVRFENQRANIEEATRAEIEGIEASTMSEEQKRIRIERAEQKKAQELDKLDLKQRRVQKSRDVIQSIINTALAITKVLANPFLVAFAAATGAAQTALIASQQFAEGGIAEGPSHAQGGIPFTVAGVGGYEMEGGEAIINRKSTAAFAPILSAINSYNGYGKRFQMGGLVGSPDTAFLQPGGGIEGTVRRMADSMQRLKVVNVLTEQNSAQNLLQNSLNEGSF
jgi:chromosome segregation ATPase